MLEANRQLARDFVTALSNSELPDELLTPDMTVWTPTGGTSGKATYQRGIKVLRKVYTNGVHYTVDSLTAEEDRVVAEVHSDGVLISGEAIQNRFVYIFRIRDGRIATVMEHFDPRQVIEKIAPLMHAAMSKG
jgi:ketosteroid isomerase-like protein